MKQIKNIYKIISIGICSIAIYIIAMKGYAANPDAFIVEVEPSSFNVNQTVDLTIKAVKANGEIIKDYQGDVFIEIEGIVDSNDYTIPSDGLYTFLPQDQGTKLFSKGLSIKKSGTFTVKVSDIMNENIKGEKTIIVGSTNHDITEENILVISPIVGGIEKNNVINVLANAQNLPNAPFKIYINNIPAAEGISTNNGDISTYVTGITEGDNTLQIKILNATNEIIGESQIITFRYEPIKDGVFKNIEILPSRKIKQGNKITIKVNTNDSVTSAQIELSNGKSLPMNKESVGIFSKEITIDTEGIIQVNINLIVNGQNKTYTNVANFFVEKNIAIGKIRLYQDSTDKSKLNVTRETIGTADQYKIEYGTNQTALNLSTTVSTNEIVIENLTIGDTYYFKITPIDASGNPVGNSSEITEIKIGENMTCTVKGIKIQDQKIGDKHYLVWTAVNNIEKYIIYRSEFETNETSNMQKVGETTGTMFEYPFNKFSKKNVYAYFLVEGICKDGSALKMDNIKKVSVGPTENILLIIMISGFLYTIYKLYGYIKK